MIHTKEDASVIPQDDESVVGRSSSISLLLNVTLLKWPVRKLNTIKTYSFIASSNDNFDSVDDACCKNSIACDLLNVSYDYKAESIKIILFFLFDTSMIIFVYECSFILLLSNSHVRLWL